MAPGTVVDSPLGRTTKKEVNGLLDHNAAEIAQWHLDSERVLHENPAIRQAKIIDLAEHGAEPQWAVVLSLAGSRGLDQSNVSMVLKSARKSLVKQRTLLGREELTVPKQWKVVAELPTTQSGSIDERALKQYLTASEAGNAIQVVREKVKRVLSQITLPESPSLGQDGDNSTQMEQILRLLWGHVLKVDPEGIRRKDSFIRQGGDSITAIELATLAQECGISMSVADIVQSPRLCDMAAVAALDESEAEVEVAQFSMLPANNRNVVLNENTTAMWTDR